ncbi:MAG TPA: metallophosphoesterase family protein [Syntrophales bacterium]|nr:metallophosphoesterase family protein [Syntrophales bacterium]
MVRRPSTNGGDRGERGEMLIYAVADIHGRRERLARIAAVVGRHRPDVIVAAGDLEGELDHREVLGALTEGGIPVFVVPGNIDGPGLAAALDDFEGVVDLHLRTHRFRDVPFAGFGAAPFFSRAPGRRGDAAALADLVEEGGVFVTHVPPRGVLDRGFAGLRGGMRTLHEIVTTRRPAVHVFGHIHEGRGTAWIGDTLAVNCSLGHSGNGCLIHFDGRGAAEATLL